VRVSLVSAWVISSKTRFSNFGPLQYNCPLLLPSLCLEMRSARQLPTPIHCAPLALRKISNKIFWGKKAFVTGLPDGLERLLHETEIGRDYCVNVNQKTQLLRISLPVGIQARILILFRIVEAIDPQSHKSGEVWKIRGGSPKRGTGQIRGSDRSPTTRASSKI